MGSLRKEVLNELEQMGFQELEGIIAEWCLSERDYFYSVPMDLQKMERYYLEKGDAELRQAAKKTISFFDLAAKNRYPMKAHMLTDFDAGDEVLYIHMGIERTTEKRDEEKWLSDMLELISERFSDKEVNRLRLQSIFNREKANEEINWLVEDYREQCREEMELLYEDIYKKTKAILEKLN